LNRDTQNPWGTQKHQESTVNIFNQQNHQRQDQVQAQRPFFDTNKNNIFQNSQQNSNLFITQNNNTNQRQNWPYNNPSNPNNQNVANQQNKNLTQQNFIQNASFLANQKNFKSKNGSRQSSRSKDGQIFTSNIRSDKNQNIDIFKATIFDSNTSEKPKNYDQIGKFPLNRKPPNKLNLGKIVEESSKKERMSQSFVNMTTSQHIGENSQIIAQIGANNQNNFNIFSQ